MTESAGGRSQEDGERGRLHAERRNKIPQGRATLQQRGGLVAHFSGGLLVGV